MAAASRCRRTKCSEAGCSAVAVPVPPTVTDLYIVLYGTGIRDYSSISATLGTSKPEVAYAGSVGQFPGLDQVNLHLKPPFHLGGTQALQLQADGVPSNTVSLVFR